jgi:hypothetical protein
MGVRQEPCWRDTISSDCAYLRGEELNNPYAEGKIIVPDDEQNTINLYQTMRSNGEGEEPGSVPTPMRGTWSLR